jgi:hypothetical protein
MIDFEDLFNSHGIITVCLRMRVLNVCFDHLRNKDSKMNDVHTQNASLYYNYFFKKKIYLPWTDLTPWGEGSFRLLSIWLESLLTSIAIIRPIRLEFLSLYL